MNDMAQYQMFKNSFNEGLLYRTNTKAYVEKKMAEKAASVTVNTSDKLNIKKDLLMDSIKQAFHTRSLSFGLMGDLFAGNIRSNENVSEIIKEGKVTLTNTFLKGNINPNMCIMAWYDALSEWAVEVIHSSLGEKAPLQALNEWYNKLSVSLSKDVKFMDAKEQVFDKLRQLYPKTHKARLKASERSYSASVNKTVADAVKKIIH